MFLALLGVLITAAPTAPEAQRMADAAEWDELYLRFATGDGKAMGAPDRARVAEALAKGCVALLDEDAVLAFSLADRAGVFAPTIPGLRCLARASRATQQLSAAEKALRDGMKHFPKEPSFPLELGRQLLDENDAAGARDVLGRVAPGTQEASEAAILLTEARRRIAEEKSAKREASAIEKRFEGNVESVRGDAPKDTHTAGATAEYGSSEGPGGMRTRTSSRFVIRYFANQRDFGARADYEGSVVAALEEAYSHTKRLLGEAREAPVDVVLYTREEFALHHGKRSAQYIAGLYSQNAMRINDAAELNKTTKGVLVHEYVHAAVDDFLGGSAHRVPTWLNEGLAEYVQWRYLGSEHPTHALRTRLRADALKQQQPRLTELAQGMLIHQARPDLAYATSGVAVRLLFQQAGARTLIALVRDVGNGTSFAKALKARYGLTIEQLDERVGRELTTR